MNASERAELIWYEDDLDSPKLEALAVQALLEGHDGAALREAAWPHDSYFELAPLWQAVLAQLCPRGLPHADATARVLRYLARATLAGPAAVLAGAEAITRLLRDDRLADAWHPDDRARAGEVEQRFNEAYTHGYDDADLRTDEQLIRKAVEALLVPGAFAGGLAPVLAHTAAPSGFEPALARDEPPLPDDLLPADPPRWFARLQAWLGRRV